MQRYTEHLVPAHEFSRPPLLGANLFLEMPAANKSLRLSWRFFQIVSASTLTLMSCQVFHSHKDFPSRQLHKKGLTQHRR